MPMDRPTPYRAARRQSLLILAMMLVWWVVAGFIRPTFGTEFWAWSALCFLAILALNASYPRCP